MSPISSMDFITDQMLWELGWTWGAFCTAIMFIAVILTCQQIISYKTVYPKILLTEWSQRSCTMFGIAVLASGYILDLGWAGFILFLGLMAGLKVIQVTFIKQTTCSRKEEAEQSI